MDVSAAIAAVTVYPRRARVTRRGRVQLPAGSTELVVPGLPVTMDADSVRVAGHSVGGTEVRVVGVDVAWRDLVDAPDDRVRAAETAVRDAEREVLAVEGADAGDAAREQLLRRLALRSGDRLAAALADAAGELDLELTYVVDGASWSTAYDARLAGDTVAWTWFGMVVQSTGEDWPACELTLSTARPAVSEGVPELDPWWVDVRPPVMPMAAMPMAGTATAAVTERAVARKAVLGVEAVAVETTVSASWRLARPIAVPGDGTPHRTTVTTFDLPARLDHVTAPALGPDAHLRATVTNTDRTLLGGPVSTFLDDAFVGATAIEQTAPGGEIELELGVDDRVTVERELLERTAHKARFGSNRGAVERWAITVTNGRSAPARVTVRDRVPVSRSADVKVVDVALTPEPAERDELGRVEWLAQLDAGATWTAEVRFGVEHPKDTPITGWR